MPLPDPTEPDEPPPDVDEPGWTLQPNRDVCAKAPAPRSDHQMAWFWAHNPIQLDGRAVERGFVVYGGLGSGGTALDDLWVYDLSNWDIEGCPWIRIDAPGGLPAVYGGSLVFDETAGAFFLAGGFEQTGTGGARLVAASSEVRFLELDALEGGLWSLQDLPPLGYGFSNAMDGSCTRWLQGTCARVELAPGDDGWGLTGCTEHFKALATRGGVPVTGCERDVPETYTVPDACDECDQVAQCHATTGGGFVHFSVPFMPTCARDPACVGEGGPYALVAPGLAEHGPMYDPLVGQLVLYGGTTGCSGNANACAPWQQVLAAGGLGPGAQPAAANHGGLVDIRPFGSAPVPDSFPLDESVWRHPDWPAGATSGVRKPATATLGLSWNLADRAFDDPDRVRRFGVALGGTRHQWAAAERRFEPELTEEVRLGTCWLFTEYEEGGFEYVAIDATETTGADLPQTVAVLDLDTQELRGATAAGSSVFPARYGAGATAVGPDTVVVVGGVEPSFTADDVLIVTFDSVAGSYRVARVPESDPADRLGARAGARVVYDPIEGRAFVFGGHPTDARVWAVGTPNTEDPEVSPTYEVRDVRVDLSYTPTGGGAPEKWIASTDLEIEHRCSTSTCYATDLTVYVPVPELTPEVTFTWPDGARHTAWPYARPEIHGGTEPGTSVTEHLVRLPRLLADGERVRVRVEYEVEPRPRQRIEEVVDRLDFQRTAFGSDARALYHLGALAAWVDDGSGEYDPVVAITEVRVRGPSGHTAIAPGRPDTLAPPTSGGTSTVVFVEPPPVAATAFDAFVIEGLAPGELYVAGGTRFYLYEDTGLPASAQTSVRAYGSDGRLAADVGFLERRLGDFPSGDHHLIFLRESSSGFDAFAGMAFAGSALVYPYPNSGAEVPADTVRSVVVHELGHGWFGYRLRATPETRWLMEAMPSLLDAVHSPGVAHNALRLEAGVQFVIDRHLLGRSYDLEVLAPEVQIAHLTLYRAAPYTAAQLHHVFLADAPGLVVDEEPAWTAWRELLASKPVQARLQASDVSGWLAARRRAQFYDQWIRSERIGTPLLGASLLDADEMWVRVEQVQERLYGMPLFADVPYHLGCHPHGHPEKVAFDACTATSTDAEARPYLMPEQETTDVQLARAPDLDTEIAHLPAYTALFANHLLLPEQVPLYGLSDGLPRHEEPALPRRAPTWLLRCGSAQRSDPEWPICGPGADADHDGYPEQGDCDDSDDLVYPGAEEGPAPGVDYDCDGWGGQP